MRISKDFFQNFQKFTNVRMCKVTTMCGSNPTHHPGMHSHNVWYGRMCTVSIMRNICKKLYHITVNLLFILYIMYVRTYERIKKRLLYQKLITIDRSKKCAETKKSRQKNLEKY